MDLHEYLKHSAHGATIVIITPVSGGPLVAHCWRQANREGARGWEFAIADYHGKLLGQGWTAGGKRERNREVLTAMAQLGRTRAVA